VEEKGFAILNLQAEDFGEEAMNGIFSETGEE
jgi:hypothetical protein